MKKLFTPLEITKTKKNHKDIKSLTGFKNKKVLIMGLGLLGGGKGAVKFFVKEGARVSVTDKRTPKDLKESLNKIKRLPVKLVLGRHRKEDFKNCDLIIKNPAVPNDSPYLGIARKNNIPIKTDIDIFFDLCKVPIIGVTGTKGKSTVATLIYLFLKNKYPATILAGNIGVSPLEILPKLTKKGKVVLELSSFELENLKKSPRVAVITTIFPDHLNRYKSLRDYIKAKEPIFKYQKKKDILVLNYNNPYTRKFALSAPSKVYFFKDSNISAALVVAKIFKISKKNIEKVLSNFKGVPNRQELIAVKKGVKYINDTTSTTPQSAILAINTFKKRFPDSRIILIAGGLDKNLNYKDLAKEIQKKVDYLVLLPGTASNKLKKELKKFRIYPANSMEKAVLIAKNLAKKGDIVLFSPGAASFNLFKNEFDRGKKFRQALKKSEVTVEVKPQQPYC